MKPVKPLLAILFYSLFLTTLAQTPNFRWARGFGGTNNEYCNSVAVDNLGNVYTTGGFKGNVDFDPGAGVFNLSSSGGLDVFILKLDAMGNFVWAIKAGGVSDDAGNSIKIDVGGNLYITGYFNGTGDFDPGAGMLNLSSNGGQDIFIMKINNAGNLNWAKAIGGSGDNDLARSMDLDGTGNIYVGGSFENSVDFDPGPGTSNLNTSDVDIFILKLDASGNFIWAKSMGGSGYEIVYSLAVDNLGNVYSTGVFESSTADFDPSISTFIFTNAGSGDVFISKLNSAGDFIWAKQISGPDHETAHSLAVDNAGNVVITGDFSGILDFDPDAGTYNLDPALGTVFIAKYSGSGELIWAKQVGGGYSFTITTDDEGSIYTSGWFGNPGDFDPGTSVFNLSSQGGSDVFISKLDDTGNFSWALGVGGIGDQISYSIVAEPTGTLYLAGIFDNVTDFDPGTNTYPLTVIGGYDAFVMKLSTNLPPSITFFDPLSGPIGTTVTITGTNFDTTPSNNIVMFNGITAVVTASSATSITTAAPTGATTGAITVTVGGNTATSSTNFIVTVPTITITTQPSDAYPCTGATASFTVVATGTTNITFQWQFSANTSPLVFSDISNGAGYLNASTSTLSINTVGNFGEGSYRCRINGDFVTEIISNDEGLFINPLPASPTTGGNSVCGTGSTTLGASGGTNGLYRWYTTESGGTAITGEVNDTYITPLITTTTSYYVSIDDGTCESIRTEAIAQIIPPPSAPTATGASGFPPAVLTLTASGGTNGQYRWYTSATGGTALASEVNSSYTTPSLSISTTYYVSIDNGQCESLRTPVVATIKSNSAPVILSTSAKAPVEGQITISLTSLISDPDDNLDFSTLSIIKQPISGARATIEPVNNLVLDYSGISFSGTDRLTIGICDQLALCSEKDLSIEVVGDITVFNAISPNGDDKNPVFFLQYIDILANTKENKVTIFNRWGDVVFEKENYDNVNRVFRGLNKSGDELPTGTYFYRIEFVNGTETKTGFLALRK